MNKNNVKNLTTSHTLIKNTIYSFFGQGAPLIAAIFSIPLLIHSLGTERFGILTLAWVVISYFSLFDLGLGRALTQLTSEKLGEGKYNEIPELFWTASILMTALGCIGAFIALLISPWLVSDVLKITESLQPETLRTFYLLSISIPIVTGTSGFSGFLSALQRFDLINFVRIPMGLFTSLAPLAIIPFTNNLFIIILTLCCGRLFSFILHLILCIKSAPELKKNISFQVNLLSPMMKFGGWMTISNIVGPIMVYLDRFLIGSIITVSAVAYYTTPYEVITKLWIIPSALIGVLFPAFSTIYYANDYSRTADLYRKGMKYIFIAMFPIVLIINYTAYEVINFWIGKEFADASTVILKILSIGVLINSLSQVPFSLIQAIGRPNITAKIHCIELPIYIFMLISLIQAQGAKGAAVAWLVRVIIDSTILLAYSEKIVFKKKINFTKIIVLIITIFSFFVGSLIGDPIYRITILAICLLSFGWLCWRILLDHNEKRMIKNSLTKVGIFRV